MRRCVCVGVRMCVCVCACVCEWVDALAFSKRRIDGRRERIEYRYTHWTHGCSKVIFKIQYIHVYF